MKNLGKTEDAAIAHMYCEKFAQGFADHRSFVGRWSWNDCFEPTADTFWAVAAPKPLSRTFRLVDFPMKCHET